MLHLPDRRTRRNAHPAGIALAWDVFIRKTQEAPILPEQRHPPRKAAVRRRRHRPRFRIYLPMRTLALIVVYGVTGLALFAWIFY
jgi:hypothetical protein